MTTARFGTFWDLQEMASEPLRPVALALREAILQLHPEVSEVVRLGERAATYGLGPKKNTEGYAYIMPHTKWINLGFFRGAALPDPGKLLEGAGAAMRHVKIRSVEEARRPEAPHPAGRRPRRAAGPPWAASPTPRRSLEAPRSRAHRVYRIRPLPATH